MKKVGILPLNQPSLVFFTFNLRVWRKMIAKFAKYTGNDRKKAEEFLQDSKMVLVELLQNIEDPLFLGDASDILWRYAKREYDLKGIGG